MKIYRIEFDPAYCISLTTKESLPEGLLQMNCISKKQYWGSISFESQEPRSSSANFLKLAPGSFIIDPEAFNILGEFLHWSGELLPIDYCGVKYYIHNVLECVNCLDERNSVIEDGDIVNYVFHRKRMTESSIFKIPETRISEVLTFTGQDAPEDEFKTIVEREGLKGLLFKEIWSDD